MRAVFHACLLYRSRAELEETKPVWAGSCGVGRRAAFAFQRWRSKDKRTRYRPSRRYNAPDSAITRAANTLKAVWDALELDIVMILSAPVRKLLERQRGALDRERAQAPLVFDKYVRAVVAARAAAG